MSKEKCPNCNGAGKVKCPKCKGTGQLLKTEVIRHARCAVELQKRLVPHAVAQVKLVLHEVLEDR